MTHATHTELGTVVSLWPYPVKSMLGEELPQDPGILRTAVRQSQGHVGVYAAVVRGGTLRRSDRVRLVA